MKNKVKWFIVEILISVLFIAMTQAAFADDKPIVPKVDLKYMFPNDSQSVRTLTTDSVFRVGEPFYLVLDIAATGAKSVRVTRPPKWYDFLILTVTSIPFYYIFGKEKITSLACDFIFTAPQILQTSISESAVNINISNNEYFFNIPFQNSKDKNDNAVIEPTKIIIKCIPEKVGSQTITISFDDRVVDSMYKYTYVLNVGK